MPMQQQQPNVVLLVVPGAGWLPSSAAAGSIYPVEGWGGGIFGLAEISTYPLRHAPVFAQYLWHISNIR